MTILYAILITCFSVGLFLIVCGAIISNIAVQRMRIVLNKDRTQEDQLRWHDAIQKVAQGVIDMYRTAYPDGPLYRNLVISYYMLGIGGALVIGSAFAIQFFDPAK